MEVGNTPNIGNVFPLNAMQEFLNAAEAGKADAMIVWQGFLERESLPERNWEMNLKATRKGMVNQDKQRVWRLLTSQKVMKVIISNGKNGDLVCTSVNHLSLGSGNIIPPHLRRRKSPIFYFSIYFCFYIYNFFRLK